MSKYYEFELAKAADVVTKELFKLKEGETFVITADTSSDMRVVEATARSAFALGAKPMVIWLASPLGVGKAADAMLPRESLVGALKGADAWVEHNDAYILYSDTQRRIMSENPKLRYLCLVKMKADTLVRCIGRIDFPLLGEFLKEMTNLLLSAREMRITTPIGGDVSFKNRPMEGRRLRDRPGLGYADTPGTHMMTGQIAWGIDLESLNGKIVFDGSAWPPIGILKGTIELSVEKGKIVKIEGGTEAREYENWLKSWDDLSMLNITHVCFGFNPGAKLTGNIPEDERVWAEHQWGLGPRGAPSHTDGICLNSSVWMDGKQILDEGRCVHPKLAELAKKLGKQ